MQKYSVLITVYHKANPDHFLVAIQSMLNQTVKTDDFVIVCDGPLTPDQDNVLNSVTEQHPGIFTVVRLPENVGIGMATNEGLRYCKNELVAKMDADDIADPQRCEKQIHKFEENPELVILGGYIEEFDHDPEKPFAIRSVPQTNNEIRKFARRRQPFNNQTVMYRRSAVFHVGGYRNFRRSEDYDLYVRMLHAGYYSSNLNEILTRVRVDNGARYRRASVETLKGCARSRWNAFRLGYSSLVDVLVCLTGELVILFSPGWLQHLIYGRFLRMRCGETHQNNSMVGKCDTTDGRNTKTSVCTDDASSRV